MIEELKWKSGLFSSRSIDFRLMRPCKEPLSPTDSI
jgi:hypothetical protein